MQQLAQDTQLFAQRAQIITVPPICLLTIASYDFSRTGELIELAVRSTEQWIEHGGLSGGETIAAVHQRAVIRAHAGPLRAGAAIQQRCGAQLPSCTDSKLSER